ncbi:MAG: chromosome segregation protein SMC [Clostridia bacterium]|nr:chromosome segregation protein SMC [Clostridia bacterium]
MRLKRLEIYGFKSFADRTVIEFNQGITGVVGPNGSGKSNLSDAVRWVLGEQSAKSLRGGKMEDIIFGGTEKRRRLGYCEVSLVFDNEDHTLPIDYTEVMVTRRAYRSGEGEYYLNKTACRLKDILELFRDTGIGRDGYSIVGQGRIDSILSAKSEDRRGVFEEAAGIVKYRTRKEESEKRLANMQDNLVRIEDILSELEKQLGPLEKASQTARRYLALRDELRKLECTSFVLRSDRDGKRIAEIAQLLEELRGQIQRQEEEAAEKSIERERLGEEVQTLENAVTEGHSVLLNLTREAEAREGMLNVLGTEIAGAEKEAAAARESLDAADERLGAITVEQTAGEKSRAEDEEAIRLLEGQCAAAEEAVNEKQTVVKNAEAELENHQSRVIHAINRLSDVKTREARLTTMRSQLSERRAEAENEKESLLGEAESIKEQLEEAKAYEESCAAREKDALRSLQETDEKQKAVSQQIGTLYGTLDEQNAVKSKTESRLHVLREMVRDYAGYQQPVKRVLQKAEGDPRIHGVVATLIKVPSKYEKAIEAVLGGALQHIVTEDEYAARDMIEYLRRNNIGRATFLPLSTIRGHSLQPAERQALGLKGALGVASELISYDPRYKGIVENLLGRTVIAEDLDSGIEIMRKGRHAFRLVTLAGDVMHSGGSMTGGSAASRMTSLLSRDREIEEHVRLLEKTDADIRETKAAIQEARAKKDALTAERTQTEGDLQRSRIDLSIASERIRTLRRHEAECAEATERNGELLEQISMQLTDLEAELSSAYTAQEGEQKSSEEMHRRTQELSDALASAREALESGRNAAQALQLQLTGRRKDLEETLRNLKRLAQERQTVSSQRETLEQRIGELILLHQQKMEEQAAAQKEKDVCAAKLKEAETELEARRQRRSAAAKQVESLTAEIEQIRETAAAASERAHKSEILMNRLQSELSQQEQRIWEEYELTYAGAKEYVLPEFDAAKDGQRIGSIRQEIRAIGPVNLSATEEYLSCKERFDDLTRQRDDLIKAREDLQRIIDALQREMETQFMVSFRLLQQYLSETFTRLFGGGSAELRLSDESDVLGSGIEIAAQPPGKKLQMLSLLSGGERALTAIAILFAMLKLKPTPFCFLDEIEAALDDGNISTFAAYLQEFSKQTQFVIVTHRKGTMEYCDSLYGVSMEEKGVSKMLSVELKDVKEDSAV